MTDFPRRTALSGAVAETPTGANASQAPSARAAGRTARDIVVTINGPGEISAWLYPFVAEARRAFPDCAIRVVLLPCVFSSGVEIDVVGRMEGVASVCSDREGMAFALGGKLPTGVDRDAVGPVLHFGGEPWLSYLVARRLRRPIVAYAEHPFVVGRLFDEVLFSGTHDAGKVTLPQGATVIGDLMVDAVRRRCPDRRSPLSSEDPVIGVYPGSRDYLVKYMLPFFAKTFDLIKAARPNAQAMLALSDFISLDYLRDFPDPRDGRPIDGDAFDVVEDESGPRLRTSGGNFIAIANHPDVARAARVALALPGTTTAELAALGIPAVVTIPTHRGELSPLPGLAGHVGRIPLIGAPLKRALAVGLLKRLGLLALPNRRAGREVVPEVVGLINALDVADVVLRLLDRDPAEVEAELVDIMGPTGATARLIDHLRPYVGAARNA